MDKIRGGDRATKAVFGRNRFEVDTKNSDVRSYNYDATRPKTGLYSGVAGTLLVGAAIGTVGGLLSQGVFLSEARMKPNNLLMTLYFDINLAAIRIVAQEQGAL